MKKKQSSVVFELDNIGKKNRDSRNVKILIYILLLVLILASLKFKSGNKGKSTKSSLKEKNLKNGLQRKYKISPVDMTKVTGL